MRSWTLALAIVPAAACIAAACEDKSDDDDDDDNNGRGNCGGGGPWGGGGSDCDSGWWWDSGDWWDSGGRGDSGDTGDDDGSDGGDNAESCTIDGLGLCFEIVNGADISGWCDDVARNNGVDTTYSTAGCPAGAEAICDLTGVSVGDYAAVSDADRVLAYYYDSFPADPYEACADAGGS